MALHNTHAHPADLLADLSATVARALEEDLGTGDITAELIDAIFAPLPAQEEWKPL